MSCAGCATSPAVGPRNLPDVEEVCPRGEPVPEPTLKELPKDTAARERKGRVAAEDAVENCRTNYSAIATSVRTSGGPR